MSVGIVIANTSTASSDTVLKPLISLIVLRRYTEDSLRFVVPTESTFDRIGQTYKVIDVTTLDIILLKWICSFNIWNHPRQCSLGHRCLFADEFHVLLEVQSLVDNQSHVFNGSLQFDHSVSNGHFHLFHYLPARYFFEYVFDLRYDGF